MNLTTAQLTALIARHWGVPRGLDDADRKVVNEILKAAGEPGFAKPPEPIKPLRADPKPKGRTASPQGPAPHKGPHRPCFVKGCQQHGLWRFICAEHLAALPLPLQTRLKLRPVGKSGRVPKDWKVAAELARKQLKGARP